MSTQFKEGDMVRIVRIAGVATDHPDIGKTVQVSAVGNDTLTAGGWFFNLSGEHSGPDYLLPAFEKGDKVRHHSSGATYTVKEVSEDGAELRFERQGYGNEWVYNLWYPASKYTLAEPETRTENYTANHPEDFRVGDVVTGVTGLSVQVDREVPVEPKPKPGTFGTALVETSGGMAVRRKGFVGKNGEFHYWDGAKSPHTDDYTGFEPEGITHSEEYVNTIRRQRDRINEKRDALLIDVGVARRSRDEALDELEALKARVEDLEALAVAIQGSNRLGGLTVTVPGHCVVVDPQAAAARTRAYLRGL